MDEHMIWVETSANCAAQSTNGSAAAPSAHTLACTQRTDPGTCIHSRAPHGSRPQHGTSSLPPMDPMTRMRLKRLTRAVYQPDPEDGARPATCARWLPSPVSVIALVIVLICVTGVGLARAGAFAGESPQSPAPAVATQDEVDGADAASDSPVLQGATPGVVVYITGRVAEPGVVELAAGARVCDALDAAGGALEDADLDSINLARRLVDGEHIAVAHVGESTPVQGPTGQGNGPSCIDLNSASAGELEALDGVGPALAKRIVQFRDESGPIDSVDDLIAVSGIGPSLVAKIRAGACQ